MLLNTATLPHDVVYLLFEAVAKLPDHRHPTRHVFTFATACRSFYTVFASHESSILTVILRSLTGTSFEDALTVSRRELAADTSESTPSTGVQNVDLIKHAINLHHKLYFLSMFTHAHEVTYRSNSIDFSLTLYRAEAPTLERWTEAWYTIASTRLRHDNDLKLKYQDNPLHPARLLNEYVDRVLLDIGMISYSFAPTARTTAKWAALKKAMKGPDSGYWAWKAVGHILGCWGQEQDWESWEEFNRVHPNYVQRDSIRLTSLSPQYLMSRAECVGQIVDEWENQAPQNA